jgi:hypothetical protein
MAKRLTDDLSPECLRGLNLPQGVSRRSFSYTPILGHDLDRITDRNTHHYCSFLERHFHAAVNKTGRNERAHPIVDNDHFTIRVQPR